MTGSSREGATRSLSYVVPTIGVSEHLAKCLRSIYRDAVEVGMPCELVLVWQAPSGGHAEGVIGAPAEALADGPAEVRELCRGLESERPGAVGGPPRIVEMPRPVGFARAANEGIAASGGDWIALVNDDVVLEPGWTRRLLAAAGNGGRRVAAVQGINVMPGREDGNGSADEGGGDGTDARVDGAGLAWNRRWQAVQLGRGETVDEWATHWVRRRPRRLPPKAAGERAGRQAGSAREGARPSASRGFLGRPAGTPAHPVCDDVQEESPHPVCDDVGNEVYGVSATAAVYRRDALAQVSGGSSADNPLRPFDERLDSYYEDVELADRLHAAGYRALLVPAARAEHAGALSSRSPRAARRRTRLVYANRLLVLARRLGRGFWPRLPIFLGRDVVDALRRPKTALRPGDLTPPGIVDLLRAWGRAARLLPRFAHLGRPTLGAPASPPAAAEGGWKTRRPSGRLRSERSEASGLARSLRKAGGDAGAPSVELLPEAGAPSVQPLLEADDDAVVLSAVAPHWFDEENLALLAKAWPRNSRFELIVVDNGSDSDLSDLAASRPNVNGQAADRPNVRLLEPARNLGFAAAVNRGAAEARGDLILLLNTDALPRPGALEALVQGMEQRPEAAGLAPRLLGADGAAQAVWQLRRLPTLRTLIGYCCFVEPAPEPEPAPGAPVEQPAACALLLRRTAFENAGGMDERFWPAWFEDVDLARRLADRGEQVLYWPEAVFGHGLGASVPRLGYGGFLAAYYRNLDRYARKHHGAGAALLLRAVLAAAASLRIVALPLRCPRRARGRGEAFRALWRLAVAAVAGWRGR